MTRCPICKKSRANLLVTADHIEKAHKDRPRANEFRRRAKANAWKRRRAARQRGQHITKAEARRVVKTVQDLPTGPIQDLPTGPVEARMTTKQQAIQAVEQLHREAQTAAARYAFMLQQLREKA